MTTEIHLDRDMHRDTNRRRVWAEFMRSHGINPDDVPVPSTLVYDETDRRLTYEVYTRDTDGDLILDENGDDAARGVVTLRLDSEPAFPDGGAPKPLTGLDRSFRSTEETR